MENQEQINLMAVVIRSYLTTHEEFYLDVCKRDTNSIEQLQEQIKHELTYILNKLCNEFKCIDIKTHVILDQLIIHAELTVNDNLILHDFILHDAPVMFRAKDEVSTCDEIKTFNVNERKRTDEELKLINEIVTNACFESLSNMKQMTRDIIDFNIKYIEDNPEFCSILTRFDKELILDMIDKVNSIYHNTGTQALAEVDVWALMDQLSISSEEKYIANKKFCGEIIDKIAPYPEENPVEIFDAIIMRQHGKELIVKKNGAWPQKAK